MSRRALPFVLVVAGITLAILGLANAQTPAAPQGAAPQAYRPGLGDLMTMTVQPRHTKLGLAGQEKNWAYAAYELHELEESFERAARVWPMYRQTNIRFRRLLPPHTFRKNPEFPKLDWWPEASMNSGNGASDGR